uniref:glucuronosyltransferase n=2 Tax=Zosterops TaxID=36298 RepID=A0A8D2QMS9_ZOSLA
GKASSQGPRARLCWAWISILLLFLPGLSDGGKLLVVPMVGSHWLSMKEVVEKLSERGHEVVVLVPEVSWHMETTQAYKVVTHPVSQTLEELDNAFKEFATVHLMEKPFPLNILSMYKAYLHIYNTFFGQCKDLFHSQETLRFLNQSGFDAVLTDPLFMCGTILAHHLSLPFVFFMRGFGCNLHFAAPQCPSPPSYIPRLFSFNSDRMTFFQRVENALISLLEFQYCNDYYGEALKLSSEVLQKDVQTLEELDNAFKEFATVHLMEKPFPLNILSMYKAYLHIYNTFFGQCKDLFHSQETLRFLNQSGFDAVLTDPIFMCGTILAHHLSLPFVFFMRGFGCNLHFAAPQCPSPPSYIPRLFSFNSDRMTFFQRVENALISLLEFQYCNDYYGEALKLSSEVLQKDVSLMDLVNSAAIWLLRFDFVFEYVRPVMPNMVFVGGINCAKGKPLPKVMFLYLQIVYFSMKSHYVKSKSILIATMHKAGHQSLSWEIAPSLLHCGHAISLHNIFELNWWGFLFLLSDFFYAL